MNAPHLFRLSAISIVDLAGKDAVKIAQNLTTNDLDPLETGVGCETFVTDVRGKALGHYVIFRTEGGLRFIGAAGQSQTLAFHTDRYTIREDSVARVRDDEWVAVVLDSEASNRVAANFERDSGEHRYRTAGSEIDGIDSIYEMPWLGDGTKLLLIDPLQLDAVMDWVTEGLPEDELGDDVAFHEQRARVGFPWYGTDLDETNLPQEADRNEAAICFTKGCYLGQETVARLDALGQVQKKLVRWSLDHVATPDSTLTSGERIVGRLTSVAAAEQGGGLAIGYARRSHFDPGSMAEGIDAASGVPFSGRVIEG